jgi:protein SCO1/2
VIRDFLLLRFELLLSGIERHRDMKNLLPILIILPCIFAGCKKETPLPFKSVLAVQTYDARGIVRQITPDRSMATVQHEAITNFMGAMTMDFTVKNTNDLQRIAPGDEITFRLCVTKTNSWIESIRFVSHVIEEVTNNVVIIRTSSPELKPGDLLPDFTFTDEDGHPVRFSDFRGHVLAFTFFFIRCPLPDYCPRMDLNLATVRALLRAMPYAPTNWQFLSISFDPEFDLPDKLSNYANYYRQADADRWLFAVADTNTLDGLAPLIDLRIRHEDGSISHNLRTVVLDPQGHITRQFDGNQWTPKELADAMLDAARTQTNSTAP